MFGGFPVFFLGEILFEQKNTFLSITQTSVFEFFSFCINPLFCMPSFLVMSNVNSNLTYGRYCFVFVGMRTHVCSWYKATIDGAPIWWQMQKKIIGVFMFCDERLCVQIVKINYWKNNTLRGRVWDIYQFSHWIQRLNSLDQNFDKKSKFAPFNSLKKK